MHASPNWWKTYSHALFAVGPAAVALCPIGRQLLLLLLCNMNAFSE